jgi:hypothetical protein
LASSQFIRNVSTENSVVASEATGCASLNPSTRALCKADCAITNGASIGAMRAKRRR